jgi:GNAT superfamily N-acetyltransferase
VGDGIRNRAWGLPDCFAKTPLVGVEVYDAPNDECIGWAFLVARQGFADIEEFFVRPTYRGKGYGTDLVELIRRRPQLSDMPLRLWVSHADRAGVATEPFRRIVKQLGLSINPASRRWASYVGM